MQCSLRIALNSASHSPWVVRGNSASHSPWVVRQVAFKNSAQRFPMGRVLGPGFLKAKK
ncbi:hypothetical protein [Leptospira kirschneri]|uniref:hypothetical protein n=1 Tax=Leptospira kirschneri TaxID=29507 RepID=UPI003565274E